MSKGKQPVDGTALPLGRVKAIAREEESFGRIACDALELLARAGKRFLQDLVRQAAQAAPKPDGTAQGRRTAAAKNGGTAVALRQDLGIEDLLRVINGNEKMDFLRDVAAEDSKEAAVRKPKAKKAKKQHGIEAEIDHQVAGMVRAIAAEEQTKGSRLVEEVVVEEDDEYD